MNRKRIIGLCAVLGAACVVGAMTSAWAQTIITKDYLPLRDMIMTFTGGAQIVVTESVPSPCNQISEAVFGVKFPGDAQYFFNYDSEGNFKYYGELPGSGYLYIVPQGGVQMLPSELEVGRTYTSQWTASEYSYPFCWSSAYTLSVYISISVTGPEWVSVPAGTFETYQMVQVGNWQHSSGSSGGGTSTFWRAAGIGIVKMTRGGVTYELESYPPPAAPALALTTSGTTVTVSWTPAVSATGYTLSYAPYPYTGPETIGSFDMGSQTTISVDLWEGAAFYVAVQAYNGAGGSDYSNIGYFVIP